MPREDEQFFGELANKLGWLAHPQEATDTTPAGAMHGGASGVGSSIVSKELLGEVSQQLWSNEVYGRAASDLVAHAAGQSHLSTYWIGRGERGALYMSSILHHESFDMAAFRGAVTADMLPQDIAARVETQWESTINPYTLQIELGDSRQRFEGRLVRVERGPIDAGRLAVWLAHNGYATHELHGTLGKAIDVLRAVSGNSETRAMQNLPEDERFITYKALLGVLDGLAPKHKARFRDKLQQGLAAQTEDGKPDHNGEIIVEGGLVFRHSSWRYDSVAYPSLLAVAAQDTPEGVLKARLERHFSPVQ